MSRLLRLAMLSWALLFAQLAFAWHGADHLADSARGYDDVCQECLAIASALPAPPGAVRPSPGRVDTQPPDEAAVPARLSGIHRTHFLSRAPPSFPG